MKKVKIPEIAVKEIKRLQWQIEEIMRDLEKHNNRVRLLEGENSALKMELKKYEQPN